MGVHAEAVSLVCQYLDDAYRLQGKEKWWQQRAWFSLVVRSRCASQPPFCGGSDCTWLPVPPESSPPQGKEQVLMYAEAQAGRIFQCCVLERKLMIFFHNLPYAPAPHLLCFVCCRL